MLFSDILMSLDEMYFFDLMFALILNQEINQITNFKTQISHEKVTL
jgi:hypothetical protein